MLSAPVKAWNAGSAAVFKGPNARMIGCRLISRSSSDLCRLRTLYSGRDRDMNEEVSDDEGDDEADNEYMSDADDDVDGELF